MSTKKDIADVDVNLRVQTEIKQEGIRFYDVLKSPFKIHGVKHENGQFRRIPENVAKSVSEDVYFLHRYTAGGRVRFRTDSSYVAIVAKMPNIGKMPHFPLTGSAGFDLYLTEGDNETYSNTFMPPFRIQNGYESIFDFKESKMREITINFPLYSDVSELYIGLDENAVLEEPTPYAMDKMIVYYGHSITQGGCASHPGNAYPSILSRRFHCDYTNLGFSGSAKGEVEMADYVASLKMDLFVYDYDHNAPTADHLENTHERMFRIIRKAQPSLPIVMLTSTTLPRCSDDKERRKAIIYKTYQNALEAGDKNVYFLDGSTFFDEFDHGLATVEGCHPNDLGFVCIAKAVGDMLEKIMNKG